MSPNIKYLGSVRAGLWILQQKIKNKQSAGIHPCRGLFECHMK
jgi:hypothetical protein